MKENNINILNLENVSKIYKQGTVPTYALNKINLEVKMGEILIILGPSGSGKTTLLNVLSGLDNINSGNINYINNGKSYDISKYSQRKLTNFRKKYLGFIFQTYNLLNHLNVIENIKVGSALGKNKANINEIIELVGLEKHKTKYVHELSGGEQQRVSIARALAKNPEIMFADEPTGALDEKTGKKVLETLIKVNENLKTTMIIVTHNPGIALIGDRVIHMHSGKIDKEIINEKRIKPKDIPWG